EYFKYMVDLLKEENASHIQVFGGGGGTIIPREIKELHDYGVTWIFSPEDGRKMGLQGMINEMMRITEEARRARALSMDIEKVKTGDTQAVAQGITYIESQAE